MNLPDANKSMFMNMPSNTCHTLFFKNEYTTTQQAKIENTNEQEVGIQQKSEYTTRTNNGHLDFFRNWPLVRIFSAVGEVDNIKPEHHKTYKQNVEC